MLINVVINGIEDAIKNFEKIEKKAAKNAYEKAVKDVAEKIGELSSDKVPVDEGILKSTFTVQKLNGKWFCGYNTEYAAYQHEGKDSNGDRIIVNRPGGGQSKFLTGPIQKNQKQLFELFQERFSVYFAKEFK